MGKIKSAIITTILVAAIVVLTLFAVISCTVPGSNGVKRYNSFISSIHLGSDLTGEAYTVLYPKGVIKASDYNFGIPDDADKREEYVSKYEPHDSVYIEKDLIEEYGLDGIKAKIQADAEVLSKRFNEKGYSGYSVSVQDGFTVRIAVPTNFTYAAYKQYDSSARSTETSKINQTITALSYSGELSLRNSEVGNSSYDNILTPFQADITSYFKTIKKYSAGGNYAVKINLTNSGRELFKNITNKIVDASNDKAIGFYVGDNQLLSLTVSSEIGDKSFYITVNSADTAQDYAIILNSVAHGQTLALDYDYDNVQIVYATAALGDYAALYLGGALLAVLLAVIVYSIVRYKKLGIVNTIIAVMFALTIIVALLLIEIQLTIAGALTIVLGLALICGSNFAVFEQIRKETKKGKTMQSSVKSGYRRMLTGILDLHILLIAASLIIALVCVGELAACGLIFFISSIASYVLYWFTRFMWYVLSSPARDKFKFCGFTREVPIDD